MVSSTRRYDIDALRVIAIGLLLIYHTTIGFQPWGYFIGFITNSESLSALWPAMAMLNIWRIPILFFVSGMGVYFALKNRDWKQLLSERAVRILLPFIFGYFAIVPLHLFILQTNYSLAISYLPNPGHLWFLANIFIYVLILNPVFYYFKQNEEAKIVISLKKLFSTPLGLIAVIAVFMIESVLVNPAIYELYAMTWHGFFLGLIAFFFGFCFVMAGPAFWKMILQWKWVMLALAVLLYGNRLMAAQMQVNTLIIVIESNFWIFSVFAFSHQYLNKESKVLTYLSEAAYPVYIVHMITLYLTSLIVFPLEINPWLKFILVLAGTFSGCFFLYEFIIKRVKILRFLFGLKEVSKEVKMAANISKPQLTSVTVNK